MPYTQKGKKAKRNKKKTKIKKQKGGDTGVKVTNAISLNCPKGNKLVQFLNTEEPVHTNDETEEVEYNVPNKDAIKITPLDGEPPITDYFVKLVEFTEITPDEEFKKMTQVQKDKFKEYFTDYLIEISDEISPAKTTTKPDPDPLTITDIPEFIDSHSYSNVVNLEVQLNDTKPLEITEDLLTPTLTQMQFNKLFPKKLSGQINLEDPETFAILGAHLPFNFFDAVFSSNTLTKVTFKHKDFTAQTKEKVIGNIEFKFAN